MIGLWIGAALAAACVVGALCLTTYVVGYRHGRSDAKEGERHG